MRWWSRGSDDVQEGDDHGDCSGHCTADDAAICDIPQELYIAILQFILCCILKLIRLSTLP